MALWLIVATLLQVALAHSSTSALTKKHSFTEECAAPCADYDGTANIDEDTEVVCQGTSDNFCKGFISSGSCETGFVKCTQKPPEAGKCPGLCSDWTGSATPDTRNVCQKQVGYDNAAPKVGNHYSCEHVPSGGCPAGTESCRQQILPTCMSGCANRKIGGEYEYPDSYKGSAHSGIFENTTLVCQNNFPEQKYMEWDGYCLKMPCDYEVHRHEAWNGSQPCRQYFDKCPNSCSNNLDANAQESQLVGDESVPIVCYNDYNSECEGPLADGSCPAGLYRCGRRLTHQNLDAVAKTQDAWLQIQQRDPSAHPSQPSDVTVETPGKQRLMRRARKHVAAEVETPGKKRLMRRVRGNAAAEALERHPRIA